MAIKLPQGLNITSSDPVDIRIVLTKEEMVSIVDARMPQVYLAICKDDGKLYLYNKNNDVDKDTGRFRLHSGGMDPEELSTELPGALKRALAAQASKNSGLIVDEDNNIKLNINEDHLKIEDNVLDIQDGLLIQAIESN